MVPSRVTADGPLVCSRLPAAATLCARAMCTDVGQPIVQQLSVDGQWAEYSIAVSSPQFPLRHTQLAASSVLHVINSERALCIICN